MSQEPSRSTSSSEEFDVIIVGAGSAGSLLTYRLSSYLPGLSFLVLEAGENRNDDLAVRTRDALLLSLAIPNTIGIT